MKQLTFLLLIATLTLASCATSMKQGTTATLRPDLSDDNTEIWEIYSGGNAYTSSGEVAKNALHRAAVTANYEGYDCFVLLKSESDVKNYSYTSYEKKTVKSTYYNPYSGYTQGREEVYVPDTYNFSKASKTLYVVFKEYDECLDLQSTKWRKNLYYNEDFIKNKKDNDIENKTSTKNNALDCSAPKHKREFYCKGY